MTEKHDNCGCASNDGGKLQPDRDGPLSKESKYPKEPSVRSRGGSTPIHEFEKYVEKLFKKQLARVKKIRNEHILLCLSGGNASTAMLHMVHKWTNLHPNSKKFFTFSVLHLGNKEKFMEYFEKQPGKERCRSVHVVDITKSSEMINEDLASSELTAAEELQYQVTYHQLLKIADKMGFNFVMMGHTGSRIATRAFVDLCTSRGGGIANLTGSNVDITLTNDHIMKVIRPLNELLAREIGFFNYHHKLKTLFIPTHSTGKALKTATVDRLVETFLMDMQVEFPNTVLTILRTCEKLKPYDMKNETVCGLCLNNPVLDDKESFCSGCRRTLGYASNDKAYQEKKMQEIVDEYVLTPIDDE